ncbi:MAG: ferritin family protein [Dehalococcoidia bacterium]
MTDEQQRLVKALKYAIQMEVDGKQYYTLVSQEITDRIGKDLYSYLAEQEDHHRKKFEAIYKSTANKLGWPTDVVQPAQTFKLATLFSKALKDENKTGKPNQYALDATAKAVNMEIKSRDFYNEQAHKSTTAVEKKFFSCIAAEEQGHYLALVDYKEYISDPVGWFTRTEHPHLDGV